MTKQKNKQLKNKQSKEFVVSELLRVYIEKETTIQTIIKIIKGKAQDVIQIVVLLYS